ncbi:MAG TPA: hypothetical protein VLL49_08410 [Anaerolineales bacterium]|nr:hypothetical protein [Anaerolineales bacterium]
MPAGPARGLSSILAVGLVLLIGLVWMALGVLVAASAHPALHLPQPWSLLWAFFSVGAGLTAIALAWSLWRRSRLGHHLTLAFLTLSALAVVFDDLGWADLTFLAAHAAAAAFLLQDRSPYSGPPSANP